jgi:prepilin-type N-terminal cleavage/methylation domain-containing protein
MKKLLKKNSRKSGFTIIEMMLVLSLVVLLLDISWTTYGNITNTNNFLAGDLRMQGGVRRAFSTMTAEIRSASLSSLGAYAIDNASSTAFVFYTDVDNDGLKEKIRYFFKNNTFKKGVLKPSGSPLVYNSANEIVSTFIQGVVNSPTTPIFSYYDENYSGTTAPLAYPLDLTAIRLVKITLLIDNDPLHPPGPRSFATQISIRVLKDNL